MKKYASLRLPLLYVLLLLGSAAATAQTTQVELKVLRYWARPMGDGNNPPDPEWKTTVTLSDGISATGVHYDWYDNFVTVQPNCAGLEVFYTFFGLCAPREKVYTNQVVASFNGTPSAFVLTNSFRVRVRLNAWEEDGPSGQMDGSGNDDEISDGSVDFLANISSGATFPYTYNFSITTANNSFRGDYQLVVTQIDAFSNTKLRYANTAGTTQTSFCAGSTVRLYADRHSGYANGWFEWQQKVNGNWVSATSSTYSSSHYLELPAASSMPEIRVRSANTGMGGIGTSDGWIDNIGQSITVVPAPPALADISTTPVGACSGTSTGSIAVSIGGGPSGTYNLTLLNNSNTVLSNQSLSSAPYSTTFTGLAAGTYKVKVTRSGSNLDCTTEKSGIVVPSLTLPTVTAAGAAANCAGGNGSITVTMTQPVGNNTFRLYNAAGTTELASHTTTAATYTFSQSAGTYRVRATNGNGCQSVLSGNIVIPGPPTAVAVNASVGNINGTGYQIACRGGQGEIQVTPSGGTPPYRIEINGTQVATNAQAGNTIVFNRAAGTYSIAVFDSRNCALAANASVTLTEPPSALAISATDLVDASDCAPTGSARLVGTGGATPYQYSLSPNGPFSTSAIFNNLAAGSYTGYVRAATGCTASVPFSIGAPSPLLVEAISVDNVICAGDANGSVTLSATGGMPPYQYRIGNGVFSAQNTFTDLSAATYTFEVLDASSCSNTTSVNVAAPGAIVITSHSVSNTNCENNARDLTLSFTGRADGVLNFFDNGLELSIDNGQTFASFEEIYDDGDIVRVVAGGLPLGSYELVIRDANNCLSNTYSVEITPQVALFVNVDATTDETCAGANDGTITVSFGGGVGPYYLRVVRPFSSDELSEIQVFGPTESGTHTFTNIPAIVGGYAGYFIEIRDGYGGDLWNFRCYASNPTVPPGPFPIGAGYYIDPSTPFNPGIPTSTGANINCYGNNGQITVLGSSGGMPPYTYSLDGFDFQSSNVFSNLGATNSLYVRDDRNCVVGPIAANIPTAPVTLGASVSLTAPRTSCTLGAIQVNITGGTAPFEVILLTTGDCEQEYDQATTYNNGSISIGELTEGDYTVCIRDAGGCRADQSITVPSVDPPAITTVSVQNTTCFNGGINGAVTLQISGGTPPFDVVMDNAVTQSGGAGATLVFSGLESGYHLFELTDANGCTSFLVENVGSSSTIYADLYPDFSGGCAGNNTGVLEVIPSNGVPPYTVTWLWDNTSVSGVAENQVVSRTGLQPGLYEVRVTDASGCERTESEVLEGPLPIAANLVVTDALCSNVLNGMVVVNAVGGTAPLTYSLDGGAFQLTNTFNNLAPGSYVVSVKDANNCTTDFPFTVGLQRVITANATPTNPACFGQNSGSIAIAAVGGGAPYTYSVNGGGFVPGNPITGLGAGTYTVVLRDNGGCEFTLSNIQLTEPSPLVANATLLQDATCANNAGNLQGSASGGTPGYTFQWDGNAALNTAVYNNAPPGSHTVVVTDSRGCTAQASVSVSNIPTVSLNLQSTTNELCGQANGTATVVVQGGIAPFTYTWSHNAGLNSPTASGLTAGPYSVTVTDGNSCSAVRNLTVGATSSVMLDLTEVKNTFCQEGNGRITVTPIGGLAPLTYTWSHAPGLNAPVADNLNSGTYMLTVTDANNCTATLMATINLVLGPTATATATTTACQGNTGTISLAVQGGTQPYTYTWSHNAGLNSNIATGLMSGAYSCTLTDANNCVFVVSASVSELPPPQVFVNTTTATCSLPNGSAQASVVGGTAPFTYSWSSGSPSSPLAQNLSGGTYTLTLTDAFGCQATAGFTVGNIAGPSALEVSYQNSICQNFNGAITVSPQGGTLPYQYTWSHNAFLNQATASPLPAGTYSVTVTDANGCQVSATQLIALEGPPVVQTLQQINSLCTNGTGLIEVSPTGTGPFSYTWTNGVSAGPLAQNLNAGSYTVTVTDANGCNTTRNFTIALEPAPIVQLLQLTNDVCGQGLGAIRVRAIGGELPLVYSWSHAPGLNSDWPTGLTAGSYTVTLTDANGCTATSQYTLTETPGPVLSLSGVSPAFCGAAAGTITVAAQGGSAPYTYSWSHQAGLNSNVAQNLLPGTYTISVTDANNCIATTEATVESTNPPTLFVVGTLDGVCVANDASIEMGIDGEFPPYSFSWSQNPALNSLVATGLASGTYTLTATDANGCEASLSASVTDQQGPVLQVLSVQASTCGAADGSATLGATQGQTPYTFSWSHAPALNSPTATNLAAGSYTVTLTDANACTAVVSFTISDSQAPQLSVASTTNAVCDPNSGAISLAATGGVAPYTYTWSHNPGLNAPNASGLSAGSYSITLTDANGCVAAITASLDFEEPPVAVVDITSALCDPSTGGIAVSVSQGLPPYTIQWNDALLSGFSPSPVFVGEYVAVVTDANGCVSEVVASVDLIAGPDLVLIQQQDAACGQSNGTLDIDAVGGQAPYFFEWSHDAGLNSSLANNLSAGTYSLTVTDANGCTASQSAVIVDLPGVDLSFSSSNSACGQSTGSATITTTGGLAPYQYSWSHNPSLNSAQATGLEAGLYTVTVTDANGCSDTIMGEVSDEGGIVLSVASFTEVLCDPNSGSISLAVAGGQGPLTYTWSHNAGLNAPTAVGLAAGTYTTTVTDALGCEDVVSQALTFTAGPSLALQSNTTSLCQDGNGALSFLASGGSGPYTYQWSHNVGLNAATALGLSAGSYTLTATDANGCTAVQSAQVALVAGPQLGIETQTDAYCGNTSGSARVAVSGGTMPIQYFWSHNASLNSLQADGLAAGAYGITIVDGNGCSTDLSVLISDVPGFSLSTAAVQEASCGLDNGQIQLTTSGGQAPFQYQWSHNASLNGPTATNLPADVYTVTVLDATGCSREITTAIQNIDGPVLAITQASNASCGLNNGSITTSLSGGQGPFSYLWSNGLSGASLAGLPGGSYELTVTDANGCQGLAFATLTAGTAPALQVLNTEQTNCVGATGSIQVGGSGGQFPYLYTWSHENDLNSALASGLEVGSYTVTLTDAAGCTATATASIEADTDLSLALVQTQVALCTSATGSATVAGSGGQQPYSYTWSHNPALNSATATNLAAGNYSVLTTDAAGCTAELTLTVGSQVVPIGLAVAQSSPSACATPTGALTLNASGGAGPYTFNWSHSAGLNSASALGLAAGSYSITATDINGCTGTLTATVGQTSSPQLAVQERINTDCGQATGSLSVIASAGQAPYTYGWSHDANLATNLATGLAAGTYQITATDANGCTATLVESLSEEGAPSITVLTTASYCNQPTGSATVTESGGFTYAWANPAQPSVILSTTATATGLLAGNYSVTVSDGLGCSAVATAIIQDLPEMVLSTTASPNLCFGEANGTVNVVITSGGTGPFSYEWSIAQSGSSLSGLSAGTYQVTATDANGCTAISTATVAEPAALALSLSAATPPLCTGATNGSLAVQVSGGTSPYTYQWDSGQQTASISGLGAGTYTLAVTDANGCEASFQTSLDATVTIDLAVNTTAQTCVGLNNGQAVANVTGPGPFTYQWSTPGNTNSLSNLAPGNYSLTVSNAAGCTSTENFVIAAASPVVLQLSATPSCLNELNGTASASATGGTGSFVYAWSNLGAGSSITDLSPGIFAVTATDANGCTATESIVVPGAPFPSLAVDNIVQPDCLNQPTGTAQVSASGGTGSISYLWNDPAQQNNATATGLLPGTYQVTATDQNGCSATTSVLIEAPASFLVNVGSLASPSCFGAANGSASVAVQGGSGNFSYLWNDPLGQNTEQASNLAAGSYLVSITDNESGCSSTLPVTLPDPELLSLNTVGSTPVSCAGDANGTATVAALGGTGAYTYLWSDPAAQNTPQATGLLAGTYQVSVTDANGCTATTTVEVADVPVLEASISEFTAPLCFGQTNGTATAVAVGGSGSYTFEWNDPSLQTTSTATNLAPGNYTVTIRDANNCSTSAAVSIPARPDIVIEVTEQTDPACAGQSNGSLSATASGGTGALTYLWSTGQMTPNIDNLPAGNYTLNVTDANGCVQSVDLSLQDADALSLVSANTTQTTCYSGADATIAVVIQGGTGSYTYLWSDPAAQTTATATGLARGDYALTATDANGCTFTADFSVTSAGQQIFINPLVSNASCEGATNATISLSASGGAGNFSFAWAGGQTGSSLAGVSAGDYTVVATDGAGCTETATITVSEGAPFRINVGPADTLLCEGELLFIDFTDTDYTVQWTSLSGFFSAAKLTALDQTDTYFVAVTNAQGCVAHDTISVDVATEALQAFFIIPTDVVVGQEVVALEGSWPVPGQVNWFFPTDSVQFLRQEGDQYFFQFTTVGEVRLSMQSVLGSCEDWITKVITVHADSTTIPGLNPEQPDILSVVIAPNPNSGNFSVSVLLSAPKDVVLGIYDINGVRQDRRILQGQSSYTENYSLTGQPGTYYLVVQSPRQRRTLVFTVVNP